MSTLSTLSTLRNAHIVVLYISMLHLHFANRTAEKVNEAIFQNILKNAENMREIQRKLTGGRGEGSITLTLTGDKEIQKLNKRHRGKNTPTDVLSFSYISGQTGDWPKAKNPKAHPPELLGEIVISVETACRQAKKHGITIETELKNLFAHGLLHIFGYDHETDKEEAEMNRLASDILQT